MFFQVMSFAASNYGPYRAYLARLNNPRVLSHINTRLMHDTSSIGHIMRGSKGHDLFILLKKLFIKNSMMHEKSNLRVNRIPKMGLYYKNLPNTPY